MDDTERIAQVAIMASIYHRASEVNVWLGKCTRNHEARHCFAYLSWLGSERVPFAAYERASPFYAQSGDATTFSLSRTDLFDFDDRHTKALHNM